MRKLSLWVKAAGVMKSSSPRDTRTRTQNDLVLCAVGVSLVRGVRA